MKSYFTSKGAALAPQSLAHADRLLSALGIRTNLCGVCGTKTQDQVCKDCMDKDANYKTLSELAGTGKIELLGGEK